MSEMPYRRLGRSGLRLGALSFGSWVSFGAQMDEAAARDCMAYSYERGVNFFDNAETYADGESERLMGEALRRLGWRRDTYCVSSKVFWGGDKPTQMGLSRKHVTEACHAALKRLQVEYLDLFFCHRPDVHTPVEETVRAMDTLVRQGKILYWGTSEWSAQALTEAFAVAKAEHLTPPTMEQPQYNLFHRERVEAEYAPLYRDHGLGTTIWSPLASGILTGKYSKGIPKDSRMNLPGYEWLRARLETAEGREKIAQTRELEKVADGIGVSVAQLAIAWCLTNPDVSTVILGASRRAQLEENFKALDALPKLTPDVLAAVERIVANRPKGPSDFTA
jgi:voltage-dependent potassium channel beta subunit